MTFERFERTVLDAARRLNIPENHLSPKRLEDGTFVARYKEYYITSGETKNTISATYGYGKKNTHCIQIGI